MIEIILILPHGKDDLFPVERQFRIADQSVFQFDKCGRIPCVHIKNTHGTSREETAFIDFLFLEKSGGIMMVRGILFPFYIQYLFSRQLFFGLCGECNFLRVHLFGGKLHTPYADCRQKDDEFAVVSHDMWLFILFTSISQTGRDTIRCLD